MNENLEALRPKSLHRAFIRASKMHKKVCQHRFQQLGLTEGQPKALFIYFNKRCFYFLLKCRTSFC